MTRAEKIEQAAGALLARWFCPYSGPGSEPWQALRAALAAPQEPREGAVSRAHGAGQEEGYRAGIEAAAGEVAAQIERLRASAGPMMRPRPGVVEVLEEALVHIRAGKQVTQVGGNDWVSPPAPKETPPQEDARHVCDNHCGGTPGTLDACDLCGAEVQHHTLIHDDGHMHCLDCTPPAPKETPRRPGSLDMRDGFGMCAAPKGDKP